MARCQSGRVSPEPAGIFVLMIKLVGIGFLVLLALACAGEFLRFRAVRLASGSQDPPEYPRRRFSRRLAIALLLAAAVAIASFVPRLGAWLDLALLVFIALLIAIAIKMLANELRHATLEAAHYTQEMNRISRATAQELTRQARPQPMDEQHEKAPDGEPDPPR